METDLLVKSLYFVGRVEASDDFQTVNTTRGFMYSRGKGGKSESLSSWRSSLVS